MAILDHAGGWRTADALARAVNSTPGARFTRVLRALGRATLLERQGARRTARPLDAWTPWLPHAGLFHFGTKNQIVPGAARRRAGASHGIAQGGVSLTYEVLPRAASGRTARAA